MPIPEEILAVARPKSTRVKKSGDRWLVIKRTCKRKDGRNVPVELGTIGEIKNGVYVEIRKEPRKRIHPSIDIKDYGEVAFCDKAGREILDELLAVYNEDDSKRLYTIALLRAAKADIKNRDIKMLYETSFASEMYPGQSLSKNSISKFLEKTGMAYRNINQFMINRISKMTDGHIVVDGMLKDSNGESNTLSEFSRKGLRKGSKDICLLYAYDFKAKEPVAVKAYPGNMLDLSCFKDFVTGVSLNNGMLVLDKGFYSKKNIKLLKGTDGLSYIIPLKQSSKLIKNNDMFKGVASLLDGYSGGTVFYKKTKVNETCYLYSFRDPKSAFDQEIGYVTRTRKKGTYSEDKYMDKEKEFGVIVFESNADLSPIEVYTAYSGRWEIEIMFDFYKNIIDLDTVNVHGDYRIYATEFINFLSVIISCKAKKILTESGLGQKYSYRQVFHYLSKYKMVRINDDKWLPCNMLKYIKELCSTLGI